MTGRMARLDELAAVELDLITGWHAARILRDVYAPERSGVAHPRGVLSTLPTLLAVLTVGRRLARVAAGVPS